MENKSLKRINTIGKVSKIIVILVEIVIICSIVGAIIGGIALLQMPDEFVVVNGNVNAEVIIDKDKVPFMMDIEDFEDLSDFNGSFRGVSVDIDIEELSDNTFSVNVLAGAENFDLQDYSWILSIASFGGALVLGAVLVVAIFGYKLANAFSKCSSPFEENVIKCMKRFGISLIPWAIITCLSSNSISITALIFAAVVILFIQIFAYGAKIQQENDDTI